MFAFVLLLHCKFRANERMNASFHAQREQPKTRLSSNDIAKLLHLFLPFRLNATDCNRLQKSFAQATLFQ